MNLTTPYDVYPSQNIIRMIKSRMRWAGHVARMVKGDVCTGCWWGNVRERDHLEDPGLDGRMGHVARMVKGEVYTGSWRGNGRERDHLEDLGVNK